MYEVSLSPKHFGIEAQTSPHLAISLNLLPAFGCFIKDNQIHNDFTTTLMVHTFTCNGDMAVSNGDMAVGNDDVAVGNGDMTV